MVGDILCVETGDKLPADGRLLESHELMADESALTGESMPVEKHVGDTVIGATVSKSGYVVMKALRVGDDTTLSQIIRLVEEAGASKRRSPSWRIRWQACLCRSLWVLRS